MSYTIISGTNRKGSNTYKIAVKYQRILKDKGIDANLVSLEGVDPLNKNILFQKLEEEILHPTKKFIFISPEYNGSIPGILKLFIDEANWKKAWKNKKAMLVGVSTGRAGNLRGMDHLTSILHHMNIHVLPFMLPISQVDKLMNGPEDILDDVTIAEIRHQIDDFIEF